MKIVKAKLYDYKSIIKTEVEFQNDITCLVGLTGAGKTSILELLQKVDPTSGFKQLDLPENSDTLRKFTGNKIKAEDIRQFEIEFTLEKNDVESLPENFREVNSITLERFFDGSWMINAISESEFDEQVIIDIKQELEIFKNIFSDINDVLNNNISNIPEIEQQKYQFNTIKSKFMNAFKIKPREISNIIEVFKNSWFTIQWDRTITPELDQYLAQFDNATTQVIEKLSKDTLEQIYQRIPKPEYISILPKVDDEIILDDYLNDTSSNPTFHAIGIICEFTKSDLNNIRNSEHTTKKNFFDAASKKLTKEFRNFWTQIEYDLIVEQNEAELIFSVEDKITNKVTKATQRSEGLQWVLSLFFKIKSLISSPGLSHILLMDSPATAIHELGKEEIRKYLTVVAENNDLQIIYTTHEKALIDPWRLERIRYIKKEKEIGTSIHKVKSNGIDSIRIEMSKHTGSPAKYSLFGAPILLYFEGPSDYLFVAALNEFARKCNREFLNPDTFSIDDMGGISNYKNIMKICSDLGLMFYFVVDGGTESRKLKEKLTDDFDKYFISLTDVLNKDEVDVEDLIDPELYHELFKSVYDDIEVPEFEKIRNNNNKKTINCYSDFLKSQNISINKVGIAQFLMEKIKSQDAEKNDALKRTLQNYEKLVTLINKKLP